MLNKYYPAKILLLGEYTILNGSKAVAVPYREFSGHWSYAPINSEEAVLSQKELFSFLQHSCEKYIDYEKFKNDLNRGLWFESNIPHGYGLGSSGALIAAIFDTYGNKTESLLEMKQALAKLEDFFHGNSSGLDPLVSLVQKPLYIHSFENVEVHPSEINLQGFFLLNTGKPRNTGPLVSIYKEKLKDPEFKRGCAEILSREVNLAARALLENDRSFLFHHLWLISKFQWDFFPEMIPTNKRGFWLDGLDSGDYVLKLCGAGGGGYILGFSEKLNVTDKMTLFGSHEFKEL